MTIDLGTYDHGESLDMRQAAILLGGSGPPQNLEVVRRWAGRGRSVKGRIIALPSIKWKGQRRTMPGWVEWFLRECIRAETPPVMPRMRSERSRLAAHRRADARLRAAGM